MTDLQAAADFPRDCALIEVRVSDLNQLFNSFDPTPVRQRTPLEIFLYEWWPIRAEAVLSDRLSAMSVRVRPFTGS